MMMVIATMITKMMVIRTKKVEMMQPMTVPMVINVNDRVTSSQIDRGAAPCSTLPTFSHLPLLIHLTTADNLTQKTVDFVTQSPGPFTLLRQQPGIRYLS